MLLLSMNGHVDTIQHGSAGKHGPGAKTNCTVICILRGVFYIECESYSDSLI